jgi:hypothetical protein
MCVFSGLANCRLLSLNISGERQKYDLALMRAQFTLELILYKTNDTQIAYVKKNTTNLCSYTFHPSKYRFNVNHYLANYFILPEPSNATQTMYNIQFNLLISQHIWSVFRSSTGEYNCLPNALLNCNHHNSIW